MKKSILALAVMAVMGSNAAMAASDNVQGGSSDSTGTLVAVGKSDHSWFNKDNSGLKLANSSSGYIDIADGPIKGSNAAIDDHGNGGIMTPGDMDKINLPINIAQVWKDTETVTGGSNDVNFVINSIRQITTLSLAPQFGGLVIGQVADTGGDPLAVESGVYFGEWAPRAAGTPPSDSTDLNMTSADRTVWYVGDDATTTVTMPTSIEADYGVVGISQTGKNSSGVTLDGGLPDSVNLYKGTLNVSYDSSRSRSLNVITSTIDRGSDSIDFGKSGDATTIDYDGSFSNSTGTIEGQFYNAANELAGIYTGSDTPASVAFGGSKIEDTTP
ncbi:MAG: hypothetical protein ACTJGG_13845 [Marinomonas foliarum]